MSLLTLIRHAQGSFHGEDYDRLSEVGDIQARKLGEYLIRRGVRFDRVFSGPRTRHVRTAEIVAGVYKSAGVAFPDPFILPELDEYTTRLFSEDYLASAAEAHPHLHLLERAYRESLDPDQRLRTFKALFEAAMELWVEGALNGEPIESWDSFAARVERGIALMTSGEGRGLHVGAFTSAGPTSVATRLALGISPRKTLHLSYVIHNAALTSFLFTVGRFSLNGFNSTPHLDQPELLTLW